MKQYSKEELLIGLKKRASWLLDAEIDARSRGDESVALAYNIKKEALEQLSREIEDDTFTY